MTVFESLIGAVFPNDAAVAEVTKEYNDSGAPSRAVVAAGDAMGGAKLAMENVFKMPFAQIDPGIQQMTLANARTITLTGAPTPTVTCEALAHVSLPVLLMNGERSFRQYQLVSDKLAECLPNATRATIKGATHGAPVQDAEAFNRVLLDFLASVRRRQPQANN
jgi:pimeloyl-ACP methyl ester carboxylesterase